MRDEPNFNSLFYFNPIPSWVYDLETFKILDVNEAAIEHYGYSKRAFLELTIKDLRPKGEIPKMLAAHSDIDKQDGNIFFGVFSHQKKNGAHVRMEINGHKVDYLDKTCMLVICKDVTQEEEQLKALKASEEALRESEARFRTIFEIASLGILQVDPSNGQIILVNSYYEIITGYSKNELLKMSFVDLTHPEDREEDWEIFTKAMDGETEYRNEKRYVKKDGSIVWVRLHVAFVRYEDGKPHRTVAICEDITAQKSSEQALIKSEKRFRALIENGADAIVIIGEDGKPNYVSPTIHNLLGYTEEEALGLNLFEIIHPDDIEGIASKMAEVLQSPGVVIQGETSRTLHKDGSWRWLEAVLVNMLHDPDINGIVDNFRDVTERKIEEQRLKLLESVITNAKDSILITEAEPLSSPGPKIIYVNEAFTKMTGYEADEVIGKNPRFLQGPKSDKQELARLGEALRNSETCEVTTINYKKSGEEFWINFTVSPVADEKGVYTHLIAIERDVTAQKQKELEKELLGKISQNFAFENDLLSSSGNLCQTISAYGAFDFVELWLPNIENTKLLRIAKYASSEEAAHFYRESQVIDSSPITEGLQGRVWQTKETQLWKDIPKKENFIRKDAAKKAGIQTALGLPMLYNESVTGVMVIGSIHSNNYLKSYVGIFEELKKFVGSEINRKRLENDLSHLYHAIPDLLCLADFQGRFLKINEAGCDLLGYSEDQLLYHSFDEFVHPDDKDIWKNEMQKLENDETIFNFENRFITKAGEIIWLSWNCNSSEEEGFIYATAKNTTEEKKLIELNRMSSKLAKIGSWEIDVLRNKLFWSDMVYELHETAPDAFQPDLETAINLYRSDFKSEVTEIVNECIETGKPFDFEAVLVTLKMNERWVRAIGNAEMIDGQCARIYGSFQDIHERKEAEIRLQSLANNLPGVVFQYHLFPDETDALKNVTKGAHEIWEYSPDEVMENIDLVWNQTKAGGDYNEVKRNIEESIRTKSRWVSRYKSISPSGRTRILLGTGTPNFMTDGSVVYNSVVLDITQEAKNEELLEEVTYMAKIGSWELDIVNEQNDAMYWSPMTRKILEVDEQYNPSLTGGFEFYTEVSKQRIQHAVDTLINSGKEFDEELLILTSTGNEKWIRCIGKSERVRDKCVKVYGSFQDIHASKSLEIQIREILESISDAFYAVDDTWNFTYFNKEAENLLGKKAEDALGVNIWKLFPAAAGTTLQEVYERVAKSGIPESFEYFYPGDGNWYEINAYPSQGGVSAYFKNIEERKQAKEKLEKAYEEKTNILESIGDAFFTVDKNWIITYWNKEAENFIKRKREDLIGDSLWNLFTDAVDTEFYRQYHRAMETGESVNFEEYYPTVSKWFDVTAYPSNEGLSVYFKDVTLRKEIDIRLLQANERFQIVTEATNDAIWDWDITQGTFYRSNAIEKFFGEGTAKSLNEAAFWQDNFHPEDLKKIRSSMKKSLADPHCKRWEMEYRIFNKKGDMLHVIDRGLIIRDNKGKATRMLGAMTDITERKKFEQQLLELNTALKKHAQELEMTNEELEQFAYIASHDLQEPLRMVSSFMDQLKRKYGHQLDEKGRQYIHFATDGAKRMKRIILDLLEYSRAGKLTEGSQPIDVNEILENYLILRRKIIHEKSVEIHVDNFPTLNSHKAPLTQTLHCLLDNAIYYSKEGQKPKISVSLDDQPDHWIFEIADNGIGIDPQFHKKIFILFQRLHNRGQYEGTGIGLSVVKKHVESWGGKIWLESQIGEGSKFYFTIPKE